MTEANFIVSFVLLKVKLLSEAETKKRGEKGGIGEQ